MWGGQICLQAAITMGLHPILATQNLSCQTRRKLLVILRRWANKQQLISRSNSHLRRTREIRCVKVTKTVTTICPAWSTIWINLRRSIRKRTTIITMPATMPTLSTQTVRLIRCSSRCNTNNNLIIRAAKIEGKVVRSITPTLLPVVVELLLPLQQVTPTQTNRQPKTRVPLKRVKIRISRWCQTIIRVRHIKAGLCLWFTTWTRKICWSASRVAQVRTSYVWAICKCKRSEAMKVRSREGNFLAPYKMITRPQRRRTYSSPRLRQPSTCLTR